MRRLNILGLDGGTYKVIDSMIEKGIMPNLKRIRHTGSDCILKSTIPPITAPAWYSMVTGLETHESGIYHFVTENHDGLHVLTSRDFKNKAYWDILKEHTHCIFNFPLLYPPYAINGIMVSGIYIWAQGKDKDKGIAYPKKIEEEIFSLCPDYRVIINYASPEYSGAPKKLLRDIHHSLDNKIRVIKNLLEHNLDISFFVISETDWINHYFWKYIDRSNMNYIDSPSIMLEIERIYSKIDDLIQVLARNRLMIVSDHGFGNLDYDFSINDFLFDKGYIKLKDNISFKKRFLMFSFAKIYPLLAYFFHGRSIPKFLKRGGISIRDNSKLPIDKEKSRVIPSEFPGNYFSLRLSEKKAGEDLKRDLTEIGKELGIEFELIDPNSEQGPDLILTTKAKNINFDIPLTRPRKYLNLRDLDKKLLRYRAVLSGEHREEGILVLNWKDDIVSQSKTLKITIVNNLIRKIAFYGDKDE